MTSVLVAESGSIPASPEAVYAILADYRGEHHRILPPRYFKSLEVERGGTGAGTVFRAATRVMGTTTVYHMEVSEPEPGRVLMETDKKQGVVTTFTVTPGAGGRDTNLGIASEWTLHAGIRGSLERLLIPLASRPIYRAELRQFAEYVQHKGQTVSETSTPPTEPVSH